jgi:hypothetical protein
LGRESYDLIKSYIQELDYYDVCFFNDEDYEINCIVGKFINENFTEIDTRSFKKEDEANAIFIDIDIYKSKDVNSIIKYIIEIYATDGHYPTQYIIIL